ncbi:MAG: pitrilysin family protein [Gemmatimonadetes bacterium]|nr:pitrilysin family protein [Gemmatimonadota bacterium]
MRKQRWTHRCRLLPWILIPGFVPVTASASRLPHAGFLTQLQFTVPDTSESEFRLVNGLVGFIRAELDSPVVRLTAFVRAGTGDDEQQGAAEMLEWVLRRGPCWMGPGAFREALDRMAADLSVRMSVDLTAITLRVPVEHANQGVRLFSGVVREPCIDRPVLEEFQLMPRPPLSTVPAGEIQTVSGDIGAALDLFRSRLFAGHPYTSVVTAAEVAELTVDDVERFHREYFTPTNMVLAVSGPFVPPLFLRDVDQRFGDWERRLPPRLRNAPNVDLPLRETHRYEAEGPQRWIVAGHELSLVRPRDLAAFEVMNFILGGAHTDSRLIQEAGLRRGLANDVRSVPEPNVRGPGTYTVRTYGTTDVTQDLIEVIISEIGRMRTEVVTEQELSVAKEAILNSFASRFGDGHRVATTFAEELATHGGFGGLVQFPERLNDVSVEDVRRVAERYLKPDRLLVVVVGG